MVFAILTRPLANISHCFFRHRDIFHRKYLQNLQDKRIVAAGNGKDWKTSCIEWYKSCKLAPRSPPLVAPGQGEKKLTSGEPLLLLKSNKPQHLQRERNSGKQGITDTCIYFWAKHKLGQLSGFRVTQSDTKHEHFSSSPIIWFSAVAERCWSSHVNLTQLRLQQTLNLRFNYFP